MKSKFPVFAFLFVSMLGLYSPAPAYAEETEEMKYMEYIDETYLFNLPEFSFRCYQEVRYPNKFLFINWGEPEVLRNDIFEVYFTSEIVIKNTGSFDVGFSRGEMALRYDVDYYVVDSAGVVEVVSSSFDVAFLDVYSSKTGRISSVQPYEEILALCQYSSDLYIVAIKSVSVTLYSTSFGRCGTSHVYEIIYDDNKYSDCLISSIEYYVYNSDIDKVFVSDVTSKQDNIETGIHVISSVHPEDFVYHKLGNALSFIGDILYEFPKFVYSLFCFCIDFLNLLPEFIVVSIPFLPDSIIYGFVYIIYFGLFVGVWKLFKG